MYYQENTFHFTEHVLRFERLLAFRRITGPSAQKLTSIMITRAFGVDSFAGRVDFSAKLMEDKVVMDDVTTSEIASCKSWISRALTREVCCCRLFRLAATWEGSLLDLVEEYLRRDGKQMRVAFCVACRMFRVIEAGDNSDPEVEAILEGEDKTMGREGIGAFNFLRRAQFKLQMQTLAVSIPFASDENA